MSPRELLLNSAFAVALTAEGCWGGGSLPVMGGNVDHPTIAELSGKVEPKFWDRQRIPANNRAISLKNVRELQSFDVGVKELYIAGSSDTPLVLIVCIWDLEKVNIAEYNTFYLQDYTEDFSPTIVNLGELARDESARDDSVSLEMRQSFVARVASSLPLDIINNQIPYSFGLRPKLPEGTEGVLVIQVQGKEPAFIRTKLYFEKQPLNFPVIK